MWTEITQKVELSHFDHLHINLEFRRIKDTYLGVRVVLSEMDYISQMRHCEREEELERERPPW